ncbi:ubiquitin carboxyl-terminal hydrolase, putative [Leishmania donovani]|uniref:Ubiquitin carboxyl-terminal hydrolase n=1 Tax=Leishmania donovani TaxID=5661 RepID=A0A3Q8IGE5_LEIDO|nr:ubiquitin carboxyl-terminal hydrolase, putative [Leishmania donovani]
MWFPLESNPQVMNRYISTLGLTEAKVQFVDVYGVSDDLLEMVPSPVHAVLLVYPMCEATDRRLAEQQAAQTAEVAALRKSHPFFFTHQLVPNACGTIAIAHALMNNRDKLGEIAAGSILDGPWAKAAETSEDPQIIGKLIAEDTSLASAHAAAAQEGATANQHIDADIDLHFVCFIPVGGRCVELDGRKENPILHGTYTDNRSFLTAAAAAIQERVELNPSSYEFGITALVNK